MTSGWSGSRSWARSSESTGLVTLGLMFAIEVPRGGPYRFGTINDLSGTAFNVLLIPVAIRVARDARATPVLRLATAGALAAAAAGAVLPLLLVGGVMSFETQAPLVVACIEVQSLWLIALGRGLRGVPGRGRLARLSEAVGAGFVGGSLLFGAGFLAPEGLTPADAAVGQRRHRGCPRVPRMAVLVPRRRARPSTSASTTSSRRS